MTNFVCGLIIGYVIIHIVYAIMTFINNIINTPDMTYNEFVVFHEQTKDRTKEQK